MNSVGQYIADLMAQSQNLAPGPTIPGTAPPPVAPAPVLSIPPGAPNSQLAGPPAVQGPPAPAPAGNPLMNFGRRVVGRVGEALDQLTATPENRLATQVMALNLLKGGSGNGLTDFANAGQAGLATLVQARQQAAQEARANQQLDLEKQNLELNKKRLAMQEQEQRATGYARAAEYGLNKEQMEQRQRQWDDELKLRREEMSNRLAVAGRSGANIGAMQNAAADIAKAIMGRYPKLNPEAAKLMGWQVLLTRGKLGIEEDSFDIGQTATDYFKWRQDSSSLMEDWASNPELRQKAKEEAVAFAREMAGLAGATTRANPQDVMSRLDTLVEGEMSGSSQPPGTAPPPSGGSPAAPSPGAAPTRPGVEPGTPPSVVARGSGVAGLSTNQDPAKWVGRSTIVRDPKTGQDTLLRLLEVTPQGFRARRDSDGVEDIISFEEMNSEGWWARFKK